MMIADSSPFSMTKTELFRAHECLLESCNERAGTPTAGSNATAREYIENKIVDRVHAKLRSHRRVCFEMLARLVE